MTRARADGLHEPIAKRIRVEHGGMVVAQTDRPMLVWEPGRLVASYAVPMVDLQVEAIPAPDLPVLEIAPGAFLTPGTPFAAHTGTGVQFTLQVGEESLQGAGFQSEDPALKDYLILDFAAFDQWFEEDEVIFAHPRDPYSRIDIRQSSRQVRIERDGTLLAESHHPVLLFETSLPTRFYLPSNDVRTELLDPTATESWCAYKGRASYWSAQVGDQRHADLVWSYLDPAPGVTEIAGLLAFFNERVDIILDGETLRRPHTEWAKPHPS